MKKVFELFSSFKITAVAGIFLIASLILMLVKITIVVDPAWVTVVICGYPLLYLAVWRIIYNKGMNKISSALLISIAMLASIFIGELFAVGEVAFIMAIGAILEDKTVERAKKGIKQLINLAPVQGRRIIDGKKEMVSVEQIKKDDVLRILPGEAVPVDGSIISGNTSVDSRKVASQKVFYTPHMSKISQFSVIHKRKARRQYCRL